MQKGFASIFILIPFLVLAMLAGAYYFGKLPIKPINDPKACTEEAKQCPDGSFVSRTGPNCEFKSCPSVAPKPSNETVYTEASRSANWKTYTNKIYGYIFQYPANWTLTGNDYSQQLYDKPKVENQNDISYPIWIGISDKSSNHINIDDPIGTRKEIGDKIFQEKTDDLRLDDKQAAEFKMDVLSGSRTDAVPNISVNTKIGSKILSIHLNNLNKEQFEKNKIIFDQILSTFRFIP